MVLRFREDKCIRLEFLENGEQRTKMISADILFNCLAKVSATPVSRLACCRTTL